MVDLRFKALISGMKQSLDYELGNFRFVFISWLFLHANFEDLMEIFRQKFLHESCSSMSLGNKWTNFNAFGVLELKIWLFW